MLADHLQVNRCAEAGNILVRLEVGALATPGVVGAGDPNNIGVGELAIGA